MDMANCVRGASPMSTISRGRACLSKCFLINRETLFRHRSKPGSARKIFHVRFPMTNLPQTAHSHKRITGRPNSMVAESGLPHRIQPLGGFLRPFAPIARCPLYAFLDAATQPDHAGIPHRKSARPAGDPPRLTTSFRLAAGPVFRRQIKTPPCKAAWRRIVTSLSATRLSWPCGFRPVALRPRLSTSLPFRCLVVYISITFLRECGGHVKLKPRARQITESAGSPLHCRPGPAQTGNRPDI